MDEEPSTSGGIKRLIPPELQDDVDEIAAKRQREAETSADLDDNQKRWLVVGICLHTVISPALRKYVESVLTVFYKELNTNYRIVSQIYPNHLQKDPHTRVHLNYGAVNDNNKNHGNKKAKYDYTINNAADLSKLFLQTYMAHYTAFDEACDSSALLGLISKISKFDPVIKSDAGDVREKIRNPWAHCNITEWNAVKYSDSFQLMKKLIKHLNLNSIEESLIIDEIENSEIKGQHLLNGTTHSFELFNEFFQQTHVLAEYATLLATETHENFGDELEKFKIFFDRLAQLEKDTKQGFSRIDKKFLAQDETLKTHSTHLDSHIVDIEYWKEQDAMFVETHVVKVILKILESKQIVLIVGEPGIGKSMLMHHVALKLHKKNKYSLIPCAGIQDILCYFKEDTRQMFVLDDICGRFKIGSSEVEYLLKNEDSLKRILQKGKIILAATCRLDIYHDEKFHASCSLFKSNIFNLSVEYSKEDKLTICTKYLNEHNIKFLKDQKETFTPLMCYLYSKNENFNLTDFLHGPYDIYQNEWNKLQSIDPEKYCALFLCVIYNGTIEESLFDVYSENTNINKKVLKIIFDICGVNRGTSLSKLKKVFNCIIGTYLRKTGNEYRVIHDQMFDFMCCYFGNNDALVRCILRYADIKVFNERTQLESIYEQYCKFVIIISKKNEQDYFERIKSDLQCGKMNKCFCNAQMKHEKYRELFLKVVMSIDNFNLVDHHIIQESIITSCSEGYYDMIKFFVSKEFNLDKGYSPIRPITAACWGGNVKIVQLLIDEGCDVNQGCGTRDIPLAAACIRGNNNIIQLLIDKGCDVHKVNGMAETPLTCACRRGNYNIVRTLINKGTDVNQVDFIERTPLIAACSSGNEQIVQLLINKGCDVNIDNRLQDTPLTAACKGGNESIVQMLIDKGFDVDLVYKRRLTPLTAACQEGNEKIVQLLIDKGSADNKIDGNGQTPLTAACRGRHHGKILKSFIDKKGNDIRFDCIKQTPPTADCVPGREKIVQLLIEKGVNVNQVDNMEDTPLIAAVKEENENIVQLLINKGGDVNQVVCEGYTALTAACDSEYENERIVQLLIDRGSDVNLVNGFGRTPLTEACSNGNEKIVQLLLGKGVDVNQVNGLNETPLTAACRRGNEKIVQLLIDKSVGKYVYGMVQTHMRAACKAGHEKIVQILIDKGCDVNQVYCMRRTPLTAACEGKNEKIIQLLIDEGCDINQADGKGETPLAAACNEGNEKIVQLLIDKGCDINQVKGMVETHMTAACKGGNETIVQLLIEKGCDVNKVYCKGQTPLTASCLRQKQKIVQILKDQADVNQVDGMGETPLTVACKTRNEKIVQLLIDIECDVNQEDGMKQTPLTAACKGGNEKIVQLLIDRGCDVNQFNASEQTPLTVACNAGNEKIVEILLGEGCDVNQVDSMRQTPLTAACKGGNEKIVQLLIDRGCDVNQFNASEQTPLTVACNAGNENIVEILLDKGCDVNQVDSMRQTPLTAACKGGNGKIVQLLIDRECDVNQAAGLPLAMTSTCRRVNKKTIQLLIDKGCAVSQVYVMGQTPLAAACTDGNPKIVQILIDKGPDVTQADDMTQLTANFEGGNASLRQSQVECMGQTPLTAACRENNEKVVKMLIDKGCDVNKVDGSKETPLTAACKRGNENIVQLLLNQGCDLSRLTVREICISDIF